MLRFRFVKLLGMVLVFEDYNPKPVFHAKTMTEALLWALNQCVKATQNAKYDRMALNAKNN